MPEKMVQPVKLVAVTEEPTIAKVSQKIPVEALLGVKVSVVSEAVGI